MKAVSQGQERTLRAGLRHELDAIGGNWLWFMVLGIALVATGAIAMSSVVFASLATTFVIGVLMLSGGVAETLGAFWCRGWSGFFLHLMSGLLSFVIGVMILRAPAEALLALTLLVTCFLIVGGAFKIVAAASCQFENRSWPLASGIIDVVLGVMIWQQWPASSLWVIGLFVGINLVFRGFSWMGLGMSLRTLSGPSTNRLGSLSEPLARTTP